MKLVSLDALSWLALRLRLSPLAAGAAESRRVERAQRALIDAMPAPMIVTSLPEHALLHANRAARPWLAGLHGGPLRAVLFDPAVRERFLALAGRAGGVDDFPLRWAAARGIQRTLASARPFDFLGRAALLTTLTPVGPVEAFGAPSPASDGSAASALPLLPAPGTPGPALPAADAAPATVTATAAALPEARIRYLAQLREALTRAAHDGHQVGVVMLQLDNGAALAGSLDRSGRQALRQAVEARLADALRAGDAVCRLDGNGYAVLLSAVAKAGQLDRVVRQRLVEHLRRPSAADEAGDGVPGVACSIGVAVFPVDGRDAETLLWLAAAAMRAAQARGGDQALFFAPDMLKAADDAEPLRSALPAAAASGALRLHYQPRVDARTGQPCGFDALLRWQHPELGPLGADRFMPLAEATGDVHAIGRWTLSEACAQQRRWQAARLPAQAVSLRVCAAQLLDAQFAAVLGETLAASGVEPALIELALAEPAVSGCDAALADALRRVKALGCRLAIDAFGTGRSGLDELHGLPIDVLRIDASFVGDLRGGADPAIVKAMVRLGRALGLRVAADGVAHAEEEFVLLASGCDELQGPLYGPPMRGDACSAWLRAHGDLRTGAVLVDA